MVKHHSHPLRVVVLGIAGRTPFAGVVWQVLHYLEGFRRLGYDVYYVEDTGDWPYDADRNTVTDDCSFTVRYIARLMSWCDLSDRWLYRSGVDGRLFGLSESQASRLFAETDVLVNLTGATILRDEHLRVPVRIYLETDPVMPQIEVARGRQFTIDLLSAHTHHFSYGENLQHPDCRVPVERFTYHPTRPPVILDWWQSNHDGGPLSRSEACFTTVANWEQSGKDIEWEGETYFWSKHHEFLKFIDLPQWTQQPLELALACGDDDALRLLQSHGWRTVDAMSVSRDPFIYRDYIWNSRGEFTVAKDQNVRLRSGWFSDRSACYLAAGKPVITQDTAFSNHLPVGKGLFSFRSRDDVLEAFQSVQREYEAQSAAASAVGREFFAAETVLRDLMRTAGC